MSIIPNFEAHGYKFLETLNNNSQAGRITYKAIKISTQTSIIIKQFRFATSGDWKAYKQVEREINVLQGLNHPGIPRYLDTFDPGTGFCLVQEYKNAPNLSVCRSFSSEDIKDITIQLLEILIYLQNRVPTIIHRDIKPENILFEEKLKKVYLVDFVFARIGGGDVTALSSMVMGTTGFMPPEQMLNKPLTEASDLYGLGATIICLLTGIGSIELSSLVNHEFRINYKSLVTKYSLRFIAWLDKMIEPDVPKRFANAEIALKVLKPLDIIRVPVIKLDKLELRFIASCIDERLSQTITISNEIPETILEGQWSVLPHPKDPPHTPDSHKWIRFSPKKFKKIKLSVMLQLIQVN
jgi:serine/threonine protein kinase